MATVGKGPGKGFKERQRRKNVESFEFQFVLKNKQLVLNQNQHSYSSLRVKFYIYTIYMEHPFHVCVFFKGHGIWLSKYENIIFFNIPEPDGHIISPVLAGFYMFWTMIILLQVISVGLTRVF